MSYPGPLVQPTPTIRPSKGWIVVGVVMFVSSFIVFIVLLVAAFVTLGNQINDLTTVSSGNRVNMQLEATEYRVYVQDYGIPEVSVVGASGELVIEEAFLTTTIDWNNETWTTNRTFEVETAGEYVISNAGTGFVAIGPNGDFGQLGTSIRNAFIIGTVLGISGIILTVVILIKRSHARSRLRATTGTYSGLQYQQGQFPMVGQPPGQYGRPPGSYGQPPGSFGQPPGPYGNTPPGQAGDRQSPPSAPPPSSWPGR